MLDNIVKNKLIEIELLKADKKYSLNQYSIVNSKKRGFQDSLLNKIQIGHNAIIAELKKFSPSKGALKEDLDIASFAKLYEQSGAACISVLTDQKFFHGNTDDLIIAKKSVNIPILRKDFILHETQIVQSKLLGADCILLIVACLSETRFSELLNISKELDLEVLVEVHDRKELDIALKLDSKIIGINNRNLKTFDVSIKTSLDLADLIQDDSVTVVSESGIKDIETIKILNEKNIKSFLIGESLITNKKPGSLLESLVG